jgi:hypothetical protein
MADVPSAAETIDVDYLVVGAGAVGMGFTDVLIDHADVRVALVDRRAAAGGHWLDAYPFVRLHQASAFYGVASTLLGGGAQQTDGPEAGLSERAGAAEICAYYTQVLQRRMRSTHRAEFFGNCEYTGEGHFVSRVSGRRYAVRPGCRIVDARYLEPRIPAHTPPPFGVHAGARVVPAHELARIDAAPDQYVVVGSGKTATDSVIWLLGHGVDPDAIGWVRPRDPWMLDRAVIQPDPATYLGAAAAIVECAAAASSLDDVLLRLEAAGVMLRIDPAVTPTMARAPTLGRWELEQSRTVENVIRLGHVRSVEPGRLCLDEGDTAIATDAVVVHCAAEGLRQPPLVPIWRPEVITLQPIRAGFPCFGAALAGYVEATRHDDAEKNRLCPPSPYGNSTTDWARMQVLGGRAAAAFGAEPDIRAWADEVPLNPARVPAARASDPAVQALQDRLRNATPPGMTRLAALAKL